MNLHERMYVCVHACMYECSIRMHARRYVCMYVCMYGCTHVYMLYVCRFILECMQRAQLLST